MKNKIVKEISKKIKQYGLSIKDVANYTDINRNVLIKILSGKRRLKAPTLVSLCYLLQIDINKAIKGLEYGGN